MQLLFSITVGGLFIFYKPLKIKVSLTFAGETSSDFDPSFPCQLFNLNNLVEQIICAKENKIFCLRFSLTDRDIRRCGNTPTTRMRYSCIHDLEHHVIFTMKKTDVKN